MNEATQTPQETHRRNATSAELASMATRQVDPSISAGFIEAAQKADSLASRLEDARQGRVEAAVGRVHERLQQYLGGDYYLASSRGLYGQRTDARLGLLEATLDPEGETEDILTALYDSLGVGATAEQTRFKSSTIVIGLADNLIHLADSGKLSDEARLVKKARKKSEKNKDITGRVKTRTISTGLGFDIVETRYSSHSRLASSERDAVTVTAVFPAEKK